LEMIVAGAAGLGSDGECARCGVTLSDELGHLCDQCQAEDARVRLGGALDLKELEAMLPKDTDPVFALDPTVDTGHYDDGHAFGWGIRPAGIAPTVHHVLDAVLAGEPKTVVPALEAHAGVDLDGNGT